MKKAFKFASIAATVTVAGLATVATVSGWGDNAGGRATYTIADINAGKLGDKIVMNSIKDDGSSISAKEKEAGVIMPLNDERSFLGIRDEATGNNGKNNVWNIGDVNVEEGKTYVVRLYVHNNNPKGVNAVAKDVTTEISLPTVVSKTARISGFINASNATPSRYWDSLNLKSADGRAFYLDYVEGSATFENNIFKNGTTLSDSIVNGGVKVGYDKLDGNLPGCYNYAGYVTIKVKPVFENTSITKKVRMLGDKDWKTSVDAKVGDSVEYQIHYKNLNASAVKDVVVSDSLPKNMQYVNGTTKLFTSKHKDGLTTDSNTVINGGLNIGGYNINGDGYVRFTAKVVDENLICGNNRLINWAKASANGFAVQGSADVYVKKTCENTPEKPVTPVTPNPEKPKQELPKEMPKTGPETVISSAFGLGSIVTTAGLYLSSRKKLR